MFTEKTRGDKIQPHNLNLPSTTVQPAETKISGHRAKTVGTYLPSLSWN